MAGTGSPGAHAQDDRSTSASRRHTPLIVTGSLLLALTGCRSVAFYEKRAFTDVVMSLDDGAAEAHFHQKVFYSTEGAAGGIGTSAGGGCGCY